MEVKHFCASLFALWMSAWHGQVATNTPQGVALPGPSSIPRAFWPARHHGLSVPGPYSRQDLVPKNSCIGRKQSVRVVAELNRILSDAVSLARAGHTLVSNTLSMRQQAHMHGMGHLIKTSEKSCIFSKSSGAPAH